MVDTDSPWAGERAAGPHGARCCAERLRSAGLMVCGGGVADAGGGYPAPHAGAARTAAASHLTWTTSGLARVLKRAKCRDFANNQGIRKQARVSDARRSGRCHQQLSQEDDLPQHGFAAWRVSS